MLENRFKTNLIKEIKRRFPGCMIMHMDPNETQGIPDLLILHNNKWVALEGKKSKEELVYELHQSLMNNQPR